MQTLSCVMPGYNTEAIRMGLESFTHFQRDMREGSCFLSRQSSVRRFLVELEKGASDRALVKRCLALLADQGFVQSFGKEELGYRLRPLLPFQRELLADRFVSLCRRIYAEADRVYGFETFYAVLMVFLTLFSERAGALNPADHFAYLLLELEANETPEAYFVNSILAE